MAVRKNIILRKKRVRGNNIIFPLILRLLGRISSWEMGKGTKFLGKNINIINIMRLGKNRELYTPLLRVRKGGSPSV